MSTLSNKRKFGPQRSGMTHQQWRAAQRIRSGARWFFHSAIGNPTTYNVGRNKAKREARAAFKARTHFFVSHA